MKVLKLLSAVFGVTAVILGLTSCGRDMIIRTPNSSTHVHSYGEWQKVKEASCTEDGQIKKVCSCGDIVTETITKLGHDLTGWVVETEATCTTDGSRYKECKRCNIKIETEVLHKTGHTLVHHDAVDATCTEVGNEAYDTCEKCDYTTYVEIPALGHKEVVDEAVEATCTTTGLTKGKHCSVCEEVLVAQETIEKLPHTEVIDEAVEVTCKNDGKTEGKHCSVCETIIVAQQVIKAKHVWENKECIHCGKPEPTYGVSYKFSKNSYICTGVGTAIESEIVIADELNGYRVTAIDYLAFYKIYTVTCIVIPTTVVYIDFGAFYNSSITSVKYQGTMEQWHNISKNVDWRGGIKTVYCTDGYVSYK